MNILPKSDRNDVITYELPSAYHHGNKGQTEYRRYRPGPVNLAVFQSPSGYSPSKISKNYI